MHSCRKKEMELCLHDTWLKSNFKLDMPNYTITHNDRPRRQGRGVAILVRNNIKFDIIDMCSTIKTDNKAITILLKDTQHSASAPTIYIPPAFTINTTLLNNIKNSADNIIITGDLNAKQPTLTLLRRINGVWH